MTQTPLTGTPVDLESKLWAAANKLRGNIDATDYKHVVLGLIFLKNICDSFQELFDKLSAEPGADLEDRDEYAAENTRKLGVWRAD